MAEFWDLTPKETHLAIDAYLWRSERKQRVNLKLAWDIAMLSRQKRIPALHTLLAARPAKPLTGRELQNRQEEFKAMASPSNLEIINQQMKKVSNS